MTALPQVHRLLDSTREQALGQLSRYWRNAGTGDRVGLVSASVVVGGSFLAPVLALPGPRQEALSLLNGKVIPVPLLEGYGVEFNFGANNVTVGAHLDVGLLPKSWGFGPASFKAIGDPPKAESPISRKAEAGSQSAPPAPGIPGRIRAEQGGGSALPPALRAELGERLGADFGAVRIHQGATANALARDLRAQAFTVGPDIFFRTGRYAPQSEAGRRLLTHELVHTQQQARGPVAGRALTPELQVSEPQDAHEREADERAEHGLHGHVPHNGARGTQTIQRQPDAAKPVQAAPPTAAQAKAAAPPLWTDYFDEVVPAVLEAAEGNDKVGLQRAMWLIIQAYGEQSPGVVGPPSGHRNRLFNEQGAVTRDKNQKITGVVPGQESEGVYLYNLSQNEAPEKGKTDMKTSPTFGYDSPERASTHHLEQMQKRWTPAWDALTRDKGSFDEFAHALKRSGYAKADTYDTDLIAIQGQIRGQVLAWIKYRAPEMRARIPQMESYLDFLRDTRGRWAQRVIDEPDPLGENAREYERLEALVQTMEDELADLRVRLARLERFAGVSGVKLPAAQANP
ncbi:DUF4157 domain-containing protein [Niveibacterium sp. SC-1]|uniref:eCIS core domain-containing protein n=1 Tax=Niveibacterium sp. SC-1 TaxID=3135646 RepID=UPI0031203FB7